MFAAFAYLLFGVGAFICCLNFYLSFLHYPVCKFLGRKYKWVSGVPIFGSLLLLIAVTILHGSPMLLWGGITIALLDTGGLHWFAGTMLWMYLFHRDSI